MHLFNSLAAISSKIETNTSHIHERYIAIVSAAREIHDLPREHQL
jgi:hypothetical protein